MSLFFYSVGLALLAVTWAVVLVDTGMLLEPVQRWAREWYKQWRIERLLRYVFKGTADPNPQEVADTRTGLQQNPGAYRLSLDDQWWWKPLWGCYKCVAGQWGLWGYLAIVFCHGQHYSLFQHLVFTTGTLMLACIINRIYQWSQS